LKSTKVSNNDKIVLQRKKAEHIMMT